MHACTLCGRSPAATFALTVQNGDPHVTASWRREVLPVCPRYHKALAEVGREGRLRKTTWERWYLGHTIGRFELRRHYGLESVL